MILAFHGRANCFISKVGSQYFLFPTATWRSWFKPPCSGFQTIRFQVLCWYVTWRFAHTCPSLSKHNTYHGYLCQPNYFATACREQTYWNITAAEKTHSKQEITNFAYVALTSCREQPFGVQNNLLGYLWAVNKTFTHWVLGKHECPNIPLNEQKKWAKKKKKLKRRKGDNV